MHKIGFDNEKYIKLQSEHIRKRIDYFGGKLYLEFGGKLFDDFHASRVLPGFRPDSKVNMLLEMKDQAEIVIVINAADIEKNKQRGDLGITYDLDVLRLIDAFREIGLYVGSVVLTRFASQPAATAFEKRLATLGIKVYRHFSIKGYPSDIASIVSDEGFGQNDYIETTRSLVVVTAPGPGSGKMATCLSQLYHEHKRGIKAGYAKFETFPVWNLPLKHPVNIAYEAATADLNDMNMLDPYHLEAYSEMTVNYNRDVEIFPVMEAMFATIFGSCPYKSPTDMGVNMAGNCIIDDEVVQAAAKDEVIRRYYNTRCEHRKGLCDEESISKIEVLMRQAGITLEDRPVIGAAMKKAELTGEPAAAIQLPDGTIVTGKTSKLMGSCSALLMNALKVLGGIDDSIDLLAREVIEPLGDLKINHLGNHNPRLHTNEVLIALSICAAMGHKEAQIAVDQLSKLRGLELHCSVILAQVDQETFRKLGVNVTCEPQYQTKRLYHK